jgi:uncharacterized damage-inducible protein DinB
MYNNESLIEFHKRAHQNLISLLTHCGQFSPDELNRELDGFGYPTIRLQLHHEIAAEKYWLGVLQGRMDVDDDDPDYPTIESLEKYRQIVFSATGQYLRTASEKELNTPRPMITWGNKEKVLIPAQVIIRTQTHYYHHQGQIAAMCRLLGKPIGPGMDYPIM